ncbi:accessory Sec system protein Asp2 [Staphylococcus sp. IVB6238]|uniref:accessory Sec system protein Asp2 n=1 Tax=Staphylococcus sp. IVB6238 TaxID=2989770 RepID=UPI0021CE6D5D|nr:accessory Sec system protein Asp2 [Staphylococcus sp. IVB6238]UXR74072.1 accessory Sec system protein Asp2 [Staphylococcus sp. IVB6238]
MARKFKVLQIGDHDLSNAMQQQSETLWQFVTTEQVITESEATLEALSEIGSFDFIFVQATFSDAFIQVLETLSTPYTTYIDQAYWDTGYAQNPIVQRQIIRPFIYKDDTERLEKLKAVTFPGQYGDKISPKFCMASRSFDGTAHYEGNNAFVLSGQFGDTMMPLLTWQRHLIYDKNKVIQVWPEYTLSGDVEIEFVCRLVPFRTTDQVDEQFVLRHEDLQTPLEIPSRDDDAYIVMTMRAKGTGTIRMGAVHKRWSRLDMGQFILGGQRYTDEARNEFIHYFNPGDMKPPLNVYFSGYRSAEGFEGFFMMNQLNAPFILIGDPRVEGGAFYLGSPSYERAIKQVIQNRLDELGFENNELVLSGLSMGSFGALYYGAQLNPAAIIVGKPLVNIGTVAKNMALVRPNDFGTSLDVLRKNEGDLSEAAIQRLNDKFWRCFNQADFSQTTFAISYMMHDDYDKEAFNMLLPILSSQHARVMQRGVPGRHNDDSPTITSWFVNFYHLILESQFGRER